MIVLLVKILELREGILKLNFVCSPDIRSQPVFLISKQKCVQHLAHLSLVLVNADEDNLLGAIAVCLRPP